MAQDSFSSGKSSNSRTTTLMVFLGVIVVLLLTVIVLILKNNANDNPNADNETAGKDTVSQQTSPSTQPAPRQDTPNGDGNTSNERLTPMERGILPGIYPQASTRYLDMDDLAGKSAWELQVMRNEVFARYGYIFKRNKDIKNYFESQSWYVPKYYNVDHMLNQYEKRNVNFIKNNEPK